MITLEVSDKREQRSTQRRMYEYASAQTLHKDIFLYRPQSQRNPAYPLCEYVGTQQGVRHTQSSPWVLSSTRDSSLRCTPQVCVCVRVCVYTAIPLHHACARSAQKVTAHRIGSYTLTEVVRSCAAHAHCALLWLHVRSYPNPALAHDA